MHLHSFTYDYHLRCLHKFISERDSNLPRGYHIVDFLDDFMKYYPKAPNYARSLVHTGKWRVTSSSEYRTKIISRFFSQIPECISVNDISILPAQLFKYLLNHGENYNVDVFRMVPSSRLDEIIEVGFFFSIQFPFFHIAKNFSPIFYVSSSRKMNSSWFEVKVYQLYVIRIQMICNRLKILISLSLFLTLMIILIELSTSKCIF